MTIPTVQGQEAIDSLSGEMVFLSLLGNAFMAYPAKENRDWYGSLLDDELFSHIPFAERRPQVHEGLKSLRSWIGEYRSVPMDKTILDLQTDNTRLFHCAENIMAPLWESVYRTRERLVLQEHTLQVRRFYSRYGLALADGNREPDDHIGLELLFVAFLSRKMLRTVAEDDHETYGVLRDAKRMFLADHLLQWSLLFCLQLEKHARTGFYRGMGLLLNGASRELAAMYGIDLSGLDSVCRDERGMCT